MKRLYSFALLMLAMVSTALGATVKVEMNSVSRTMTLAQKESGASVDVGTPSGYIYTFDTAPGTYVLTGIASDGKTVNGTIEITVTDESNQEFKIMTNTIYATNSGWKMDTDYTVDVTVNSREGVKQIITLGNSITSGRKTFLALNGNSYYAELIPSAQHATEGYMSLYRSATLTYNVTCSGAIPVGGDYTVTVPANAGFFMGMKFAHFTDFKTIEPVSESVNGDVKTLTYRLADAQCYNYRTWRKDGLTQAGYFYMSTDPAKRPELSFTDADYDAFGPKTIKHDVQWNGGYETGDIFVNINERGHLRMKMGETFNAHAMRTWQLTDNSTNNYFFEPDFHYTVTDVNGMESHGVIQIEDADPTLSPWTRIKAVGPGTAIVTVTYDAIGLNYYGSGKKDKTQYLGGEYWSAIWPENTAVFVVTVGDIKTDMKPNMLINEKYNEDTKKNAGKYIDAEHDVIYYLEEELGTTYTFTPEGVKKVEVAFPIIGQRSARYMGFSSLLVKKNDDGSFTVPLKKGRNIIRLLDEDGDCYYQVITAKPCKREIVNATREGSKIFQPGDEIKIQYSGLRHPANKLAGIYNMSAYVTYNGVPNGSSLILGSGQYTFGSAPKAQAVTVKVPADLDVNETPSIVMDEGVIQVNGYGDPIGNHRLIDRKAGRSANFTAIAHKTYFGRIPDISIALTPYKTFTIRTTCNVQNADIKVSFGGAPLTPDQDGTYSGTYGTYAVTASAAGYRCLNTTFNISDDAEGEQVFDIQLIPAETGAWDGQTVTEPAIAGGIYQITTGAELAWFAKTVNDGSYDIQGIILNDIDLADYQWTPIGGTTTAKAFQGTLDGDGHTISGLMISNAATYQGLFGYVNNATINGITVEGTVTTTANYAGGIAAYTNGTTNVTNCTSHVTVNAKSYAAGIVGYANGTTHIDRCSNYGSVNTTSTYAAGITSYLFNANGQLTNCYNGGTITGTGYVATLVATSNANATIQHNLNTGALNVDANLTTTGNVRTTTATASKISENYVLKHYVNGAAYETVVTDEQLRSGEIAYLLGEAWGQELEVDTIPVIGGMKVYLTEEGYTNENPDKDVVTFEDVDLLGQKYYNGSDGAGLFEASGYSFLNYYDDTYNSWDGFSLSATTATNFAGYGTESEFNSCCGGGYQSKQFAVGYFSEYNYYMNEEQAPAIYAEQAFRPEYVYVTNAASAYKSMLNGDDFAKKFTDADWLKLTITGHTLEGDETGHVDFWLAKDGKIVNEWTKVDLTPLGAVDYVDFTMSSSDTSYGFMNTPAYFCIDDIKLTLTNDVPTAIETVTRPTAGAHTPSAVYGADGRRRSALAPGINIMRMSDGTVRKVIKR